MHLVGRENHGGETGATIADLMVAACVAPGSIGGTTENKLLSGTLVEQRVGRFKAMGYRHCKSGLDGGRVSGVCSIAAFIDF